MNYKESINNKDQIQQAIALCIDIQNKGIGTAFFSLMGHCNYLEIRLYTPVWFSHADADFSGCVYGTEDCRESNSEVIEGLKQILKTGPIANESEVLQTKERAMRLKQYEELKKEFETA